MACFCFLDVPASVAVLGAARFDAFTRGAMVCSQLARADSYTAEVPVGAKERANSIRMLDEAMSFIVLDGAPSRAQVLACQGILDGAQVEPLDSHRWRTISTADLRPFLHLSQPTSPAGDSTTDTTRDDHSKSWVDTYGAGGEDEMSDLDRSAEMDQTGMLSVRSDVTRSKHRPRCD